MQATSTTASAPPHPLKPRERLGRVTLWTFAIVLGCTLLRVLFGHGILSVLFGSLLAFGVPLLALFGLILFVRALNRRLLWKVRNRLLVTYVLLGLAPVVLFGTLTAIAGYIFAGQFSINSALAGLDEAGDQLKTEASGLASLLTQPELQGKLHPIHFEQTGNTRAPQISVAVLHDGTWRAISVDTGRGTSPRSPFDGIAKPGWMNHGWHGVLVLDGKLYLGRDAGSTEENRSSEVLATLELNKEALTSVGHLLGRVLLFSGSVNDHHVEIDNAEREARTAEKDADLADAQREAQEQIRDTQRQQEQDRRDTTRALEEAQREVDRARQEVARVATSGDDATGPQDDLDEAKKALRDVEQEAAGTSPVVPIPSIPPPVVRRPEGLPETKPLPKVKSHAKAGDAAVDPRKVPGPPENPEPFSFTAVSGSALPAAANLFDQPVYFTAPFPITSWQDGHQRAAMLVVISRPSTLYARLFSTSVDMGSLLRNVLIGIALAFAVIELFALWMASRLSGTITRSVAELYRGTTEIDKGNLNYRVKPRRADQLGALANSFNRMAGSIEDLLVQQSEKDRLLNELAIAQEVQQNLFPHSPVSVSALELHAVCLPARSVSGDYFDFILGHNTLGLGTGACIALGDISGKGISAALLMATLHSAVRAFSLRENTGMPSPAEQLALLNKHLFSSTQSNRYATLFLAFYDGKTRKLTYSNGGHLPPFLISADGTVQRLGAGGPVVGLLENLSYEEATVELRPGDLLAAFTDGMTEPENDSEKEFSEARLLNVLANHSATPLPDLAEAAMEAVKVWIAGQEQPDDMTLLLARQH